MTRRSFLASAAVAAGTDTVRVSVALVVDRHARFRPGQIRTFATRLWPEAYRDFSRAGITLDAHESMGEILRYPTGRPLFKGLRRDAINVVITAFAPLNWDNGRALSGAAARYEGYDVCLIALDQAHEHQIPFVSVNTCVHELLHVLLDDTRAARPKGWRGAWRESRIDAIATRLWLFGEGTQICDAVRARFASNST